MRSSVRRAKQKIRKDKKFAPPAVQNSEKLSSLRCVGDDVKLCPNCKAEIKGNAAFLRKRRNLNQLKIRAVPKTTVTPVFMSVDFLAGVR